MKPAAVDYEAPSSLDEAVTLLGDPERDAIVLAGGQSLVPMLNLRLARPELLVDLRRIEGLDHIREEDGHLAIGAMTTKRAVEESALVRSRHPLLHAATLLVGHVQIRNRGTVGGSMAHADPSAEYPAVAIACDAQMKVIGPGGERTLAAEDFFVGYFSTALNPGEVLVEVRFPVMAERTGWACMELTRRHGDFAMAGTVILVGVDAGGACADARIVAFGVGGTPLRVHEAEAIVNGEAPSDELFRRAGDAVASAIEPPSDINASAEYRRSLAGVLTARGLAEALERTGNSAGASDAGSS